VTEVWIRRGTKDGFWEAVMVDNSGKNTRTIVTIHDVFAGVHRQRRVTKPEDLPF
jgi:hypothetical protein